MDVLVLSDDIPNALRSVIVACSLDPNSKAFDVRLPTYVPLSAQEAGLASEVVASPASPFTLPKSALVELLSVLARRAQARVETALRLVFGFEDWPV